MDLIKCHIPAGFIMTRAQMSWRELQFGLINELIDAQAVIDFAVDAVACSKQPSELVVELAGSSRTDPVDDLLERLASGEPERPEGESHDKWLYLTLAWLYECRGASQDPLQTVEEVYADFGYPEEIVGFVRYMPMDAPDLGSREANEQRLMERWKQYLDSSARRYIPRTVGSTASPTRP